MDGILAAKAFVQDHFPDSLAALLCRSVARGQADAESDLDILIVTNLQTHCQRQ
jgi:predicted nucleotidyltransferase